METPGVSRIRDDDRQADARKPRHTDSGDTMQERNEGRKQEEHPSVTGSIRFYADSSDDKTAVFNKMDSIKLMLGEKISSTSNRKLLDEVFDFYLHAHQSTEGTPDENQVKYSPFAYCNNDETREELYITTLSGLRNMCCAIQTDITHIGHAGKITLMCANNHTLKCDTSPYMAGGNMLVNMMMVHAVMSTGIRHSQYERICKAAKIGTCAESFFDGVHDMYCDVTSTLTETCINDAVLPLADRRITMTNA